MKEFKTAVEDVIAEDEHAEKIAAKTAEREAKIADLITKGMSREDAETEVPVVEDEDEIPIEFLLDGRKMHAYPPTDGQLAFMLASMGRGQTDDGRFASIINVMLECLRADDKDHFESRLLTRDPNKKIGMKAIEEIFEYLMEEWFR